MIVLQCYAPGHSRFNPIERYWSPLTKWLVGVTLPVENSDGVIPADNDTEAWKSILDDASIICAKFWNRRFIDSNKVVARNLKSDDPSIGNIKESHKMIKEFVESSRKKIRESETMQNIQDLYRLLIKHCVRKPYQIEFKRCKKRDCNHCISLPTRQNDLLDLVEEFGGSFPIPTENLYFKGQ